MEKRYEKFCQSLKAELERKFKDETYRVEFHSIQKNNSVEYDGVAIYSKESVITPNFSLQPLYEYYKNGMSLEKVVSHLAMQYFSEQFQVKELKLDMEYEECKERIIFRLVSFEKNEERLKEVPYIRFLDMAVVFMVLVCQNEEKIGSFQVTDQLMEMWGMDPESLMKLARENSMRMFPLEIHNMNQMVSDILSKKVYDEEVKEYFQREIVEDAEDVPVILTTNMGINGASVLLYDDTLHMLSDLFQRDFYVLPSSIHEILALPDTRHVRREELKRIVNEVNRECVEEDEYLSDHVYFYDMKKDALEICI